MDSEEPRLQAIHNAGWVFPLSVWDTLDTYQKSFAVSELSGQRTLSYYKCRLEAIKFSGKSRVLDAACGIGQWSVALASLNESVEGIDLSDIRINVAQKLALAHSANCTFSIGRLEELPYGNDSFDAVFLLRCLHVHEYGTNFAGICTSSEAWRKDVSQCQLMGMVCSSLSGQGLTENELSACT